MEITETLNVDAESLFDVIVKSYAADAGKARNKKVPISKIKKGFTFHKNVKGTPATCKVTEFEPPNIFTSTIETSQGKIRMSYLLAPLEGGKVEVTYMETNRSANTAAAVRSRISEVLGRGHGRRSTKRRLHQMEGYIIAQTFGENGEEDLPDFSDDE